MSRTASLLRTSFPGDMFPHGTIKKIVLLHIDTAATESNAFGLQQKALLQSAFSRDFDRTTSSHDALPRQTMRTVKHLRNLSRAARKSSSTRHSAIARDFSAGNAQDCRHDPFTHILRVRRRLTFLFSFPHFVAHTGAV